MNTQTDLFGNPVKLKRKRTSEPQFFYTHCFRCGKRVRDDNAIPVAFHTDYCRTCYFDFGHEAKVNRS